MPERRAQVVAALKAASHDPSSAVRHIADVWLRHLEEESQYPGEDPQAAGEV